jgi:hypothetical protein
MAEFIQRGKSAMEEDLIAGLTREVKEEVVEHYLTERRLVELQIEDLRDQARRVRDHSQKTGLRVARLGYLMLHPDMLERLQNLLKLGQHDFWMKHLQRSFGRRVRFIRVSAFRERIKYKKLVLEAYQRLYEWMTKYQKMYEELTAECRAVNGNIESFRRNFDLLTILGFLRSLDVCQLERKQFMGENFTAEELASIDQKLFIPSIDFLKLDVPSPVQLPRPDAMEEKLSTLAADIFSKYQTEARVLMQ